MGLITAESFNRYFAVVILTVINLLNYMDRFTIAGVLTVLENPKKNGLPKRVDDTYGGLLQSAFIVSYMLFSPLFGYLGDRYIRKYIITVGIILWSAFTLLGSFAVNYWMLFGSRLLVGIGEASYATIAPTLIADLFPSEKRLRMLAIFYIAMPCGSALGYIVGSGVSSLADHFSWSIIGQDGSWRWALRVTPVFGLLAAVLVVVLLKEPVRGLSDGQRVSSSKGVRGKDGFMAYVRDIAYLTRNRTFIFSTIGFTAMAYTTGALAQWAPTFIERVSAMIEGPDKGYTDSTAAISFGAITVVAGILGTVCGSELSKFISRFTRKSEALVCSISLLTAVPFLYLSLTVVQYKIIYITWVLVFLTIFAICLNWTPVAAMLLYSIIPARRATASAMQILFSHLLGDAISPTLVGVISDKVYKHVGPYQGFETGKAVSMEFGLFTTAIVLLIGGVAFLVSTMTVEKDRRAVEKYTQKVNAQIQHHKGAVDGIPSPSSVSDDMDERRRLLQETVDETDIVKIKPT